MTGIQHYHDSVYGAAHIDEPVLLDLLQTAALHRLGGVLQHGITRACPGERFLPCK